MPDNDDLDAAINGLAHHLRTYDLDADAHGFLADAARRVIASAGDPVARAVRADAVLADAAAPGGVRADYHYVNGRLGRGPAADYACHFCRPF